MCRKTRLPSLPGCVEDVQRPAGEPTLLRKVDTIPVARTSSLERENPLSADSERIQVTSRADFELDQHLTVRLKGRLWEPMTFKTRTRTTRILGYMRFYWIGITNNLKLKDAYIALKGQSTILSQRTSAMTANAQRVIKLDNIRKLSGARCSLIEKELECQVDIWLAQRHLARLEHALAITWTADGLTNSALFEMASCPLHQYMSAYIADRDDALERTDLVEKREELVKCTSRGVAGLEVLCSHLEDRIVANDQLLFKFLLMTVNLLTCLGQFLYNDYVKKPRIFKCTM